MNSTPEKHNREADASTEDLEAEIASNAIGSTLFSVSRNLWNPFFEAK